MPNTASVAVSDNRQARRDINSPAVFVFRDSYRPPTMHADTAIRTRVINAGRYFNLINTDTASRLRVSIYNCTLNIETSIMRIGATSAEYTFDSRNLTENNQAVIPQFGYNRYREH